MLQNPENISSNPQTNASKKYREFSFAPTDLKVFAVFTLVVVIIQLVVVFFTPREIRSIYTEKFGVNTGNVYMFSLILTFFLIYSTYKSKPYRLRLGIVAQLILGVLIYCLIYLNKIGDGGKFIHSDYLGVIWSVIIPTFWALVILLSPRITKFCESISKSNITT